MTLEQMLCYVDVLATTLLKKPVVLKIEDEQIDCQEWGVFLSKTKIDRKSIRGIIQVDGWVIETGGMVTSSRYDELDDYELNEIGTTTFVSEASELFVTTIFKQQAKDLLQSGRIVVTENGAYLYENESIEIFNEPLFPPNDFPGFMPECPEDFNLK
jgi:hypothetical protein